MEKSCSIFSFFFLQIRVEDELQMIELDIYHVGWVIELLLQEVVPVLNCPLVFRFTIEISYFTSFV